MTVHYSMNLNNLTDTYDTDKIENASYLSNYQEFFSELAQAEICLLELGIHRGGSLKLWKDYFPKGLIVGLDIDAVELSDKSGRIRTYQGSQDDTALLDKIGRETAPSGFDVIIDDCSHIAALSRVSFWHLFERHLKSGGLYVIEDWGTGYWDAWADGARYQVSSKDQCHSHDFGMVGFIKELIDELGMKDVTNPEFGLPPQRQSKFREIRIFPSHFFVVKN